MSTLRQLLSNRRHQRYLALAVVAIVVALGRGCPAGDDPTKAAQAPANGRVEELFAGRLSDTVVEVAGTVERTLADDRDGSRHQRFVVRLASGHTVLVAHNIDLAPRVPLARGDAVELRGEYEWNERGGVIHWTHHDPQRRRPGGWIRHGGEDYR